MHAQENKTQSKGQLEQRRGPSMQRQGQQQADRACWCLWGWGGGGEVVWGLGTGGGGGVLGAHCGAHQWVSKRESELEPC